MDLFVLVIAAVVCAIIAALVAIINKKRIGKILMYAGIGLVAGLPIGYLLTPFIISFF